MCVIIELRQVDAGTHLGRNCVGTVRGAHGQFEAAILAHRCGGGSPASKRRRLRAQPPRIARLVSSNSPLRSIAVFSLAKKSEPRGANLHLGCPRDTIKRRARRCNGRLFSPLVYGFGFRRLTHRRSGGAEVLGLGKEPLELLRISVANRIG